MTELNEQIKRRQWGLIVFGITGVCLLFACAIWFIDDAPVKNNKAKNKPIEMIAPGSVDDKDVWRAQQAAKEKVNETMISEIQAQLKQYEDKDKKLLEDLEALKTSQQYFQSFNSNVPNEVSQKLNQASFPVPEEVQDHELVLQPTRELEMITLTQTSAMPDQNLLPHSYAHGKREVLGFPVDESAKKYANSHEKHHENKHGHSFELIPAGSFVRVVMLNGVDAPTGGQAQSNPLPVAFHVLDTANLANRYQLDIKDCRFIAAAWGDLSSERMMGRTETLSCIVNDQAMEIPIKGHIIGEDGKAGVRGRLVTKQGQLLANALLAGIAGGIGKAFQQAAVVNRSTSFETTQTVDPGKMSQAVLGSGFSHASNALEQYYLKAADKLFPVIETDGGRIVEILITQGANFKLGSHLVSPVQELVDDGVAVE